MNTTILKSLVVAGFVLSGLGFATVEASAATFTVRQGDTLARLFPSNWQAVCDNYRINCDLIYPGQTYSDDGIGAAQTRVAGVSTSQPSYSAPAGVPGLWNVVGKAYEWGGNGAWAYDCSGLTVYLASQRGIRLPRTSQEQGASGRPIGRGELQPGDLVIMRYGQHVGMFIGNNQVVHAVAPGIGVKIDTLDTAIQYNPGYWFRAIGH